MDAWRRPDGRHGSLATSEAGHSWSADGEVTWLGFDDLRASFADPEFLRRHGLARELPAWPRSEMVDELYGKALSPQEVEYHRCAGETQESVALRLRARGAILLDETGQRVRDGVLAALNAKSRPETPEQWQARRAAFVAQRHAKHAPPPETTLVAALALLRERGWPEPDERWSTDAQAFALWKSPSAAGGGAHYLQIEVAGAERALVTTNMRDSHMTASFYPDATPTPERIAEEMDRLRYLLGETKPAPKPLDLSGVKTYPGVIGP